MRQVKVIFKDSQYDFITRVNGDFESINEYYVGQTFNFSPDGVTDNLQECIKVEFL